ncbi:MAG TPA: ATP-binding cassette domain-containing protein [Acidobacteriota bacterium]|nr:ATP-binding cassette domain-containing protein [Acidobacteriota bacterium]
MSDPAALRTIGLRKEFDGVVAIDSLDLEVPAGSVFGLMGPNGSGKTTTIRTCLGIYVPDNGEVRLLGAKQPLEARYRVGYLPEERGLYPKMQVLEQLAFLGTIRGLSLPEASRRAATWLERVGLGERSNSATNELSKGMQQKVQFAAAVIHEPELVVLDEPFTGLDPVNTRLLQELILEQSDRGCTVILSSHRMEQMEAMCDFVALIHRGNLVLHGALSEVRASHGRNTLAIEYEGPGNGLSSLPGVVQVNDSGRSARLEMHPGADIQALLRELLGRVRLLSFSAEQPSMEEIFIDKVGDSGDDTPQLVLTDEGELVRKVEGP